MQRLSRLQRPVHHWAARGEWLRFAPSLGIPRAHIAGHSYGAAIALQWALHAPEEVQSLAPLVNTIPSGPSFWEGVASVRRDMYERGDKVGATDAFLTSVVGPDYRQFTAKL
jgi:pimeloyl-ACP methyl ester carboxylesterase